MPRLVRTLLGCLILAAATAQIARAGYVQANLVGGLPPFGAAFSADAVPGEGATGAGLGYLTVNDGRTLLLGGLPLLAALRRHG